MKFKLKILVNYLKVAILLTCFTVVFADETTTSAATTKTPKKTSSTATSASVNKNQNNKTTEITTQKQATKPTKKTTPKTTAAVTTAATTTCGSCERVNLDDPLCYLNPEEQSKTDFHYNKIGNCPCPDDPTKDKCNFVQRRIRNIPALQAWSACLFLMSICIAGKFHRIIQYYLYHYYPRKSPYVTHRKIFILAHP